MLPRGRPAEPAKWELYKEAAAPALRWLGGNAPGASPEHPCHRPSPRSACRAQVSDSTEKFCAMEQSYIMIKPDGVQRALVGEIIKRFEQKGYYLRALKLLNVPKELAEEHYVDLKSKPFYTGLVEYIIRRAHQPGLQAWPAQGRAAAQCARTQCSVHAWAKAWHTKHTPAQSRRRQGLCDSPALGSAAAQDVQSLA